MTEKKRGSSGRQRTAAATSAMAIVLLVVSVPVQPVLVGRGQVEYLEAW